MNAENLNTTCCCIILNYKDADTTEKLINCIKSYDVFDKIIAVDNASPDDSYERLSALRSDKIIVVETDKNGGYGYGNNYGVKIAKEQFNADYALIVNPDVVFEEQAISTLKTILDENDDCVVCACTQKNPEGLVNDRGWAIPPVYHYVLSSLKIISKFLPSPSYTESYFKDKHTADVDCIVGSLLMVNIDKFLELGGYDEGIFLYCEETTLGTKVRSHGYRSILDVDHSYIHYHSVSIDKSISSVLDQRKILYRSRLFYLKNYRGVKGLRLLISKAIFNTALFEERMKLIIKGSH